MTYKEARIIAIDFLTKTITADPSVGAFIIPEEFQQARKMLGEKQMHKLAKKIKENKDKEV